MERCWYLLRQRVKGTSYTWADDDNVYNDGDMMQLLRVDAQWVTDSFAGWLIQLCSSPSGRNTWQLALREQDGLPQLNALMAVPSTGGVDDWYWYGKDVTGCIWCAAAHH